MSLQSDRQIKGFCLFLFLFSFLTLGIGVLFGMGQVNSMQKLLLSHDQAVASSLVSQGVARDVIAAALTSTQSSESGKRLTEAAGIGGQAYDTIHPYARQFETSTFSMIFSLDFLLLSLLMIGTQLFFRRRLHLYKTADSVLQGYLNGDFTGHLSQNHEGALFQLFSSVEQLATMLQSRNEAQQRTKEFLKDTISDISHQLKTPLAALTMYQEILENEPDNAETVRQFSAKMGASLKRMEQLILAMLKITRLDAGNIVFEKASHPVTAVIAQSIGELTFRAQTEHKALLIEGNHSQQLVCDMEWTAEAIGNIVKNALDHTQPGGTIRVSWEQTPAMLRVFISDNGSGIAPEDIHHIFKRFYRSSQSLDTQGIGLGLPLAKSIVEGQGGILSVQSEIGVGTTFTLSFLTEV